VQAAGAAIEKGGGNSASSTKADEIVTKRMEGPEDTTVCGRNCWTNLAMKRSPRYLRT
jgi:hypothetical protein